MTRARRMRHTPTDVPIVVEVAARIVSRLYSVRSAWNCLPSTDEFCNPDILNNDNEVCRENIAELRGVLRVCRRGTKTQPRTAGIDGVRGLRYYNEDGSGIAPLAKGAEASASALAFANLPLVPEAILLTYAGDFEKWQVVKHAACSLDPSQCWADAVEDAGHRLVFARAVVPAAHRALARRVRKASVLSMRARAELLLIRWLENASQTLVQVIDGFRGTAIPANST